MPRISPGSGARQEQLPAGVDWSIITAATLMAS
jgi:hypothetical protein